MGNRQRAYGHSDESDEEGRIASAVDEFYRSCSKGDLDSIKRILDILPDETFHLHRLRFISAATEALYHEDLQSTRSNILFYVWAYKAPIEMSVELDLIIRSSNKMNGITRFDIVSYANIKERKLPDDSYTAHFLLQIANASFFLRPIIRSSIESECREHFSRIIADILRTHANQNCTELVTLWGKYLESKCMRSLLKIYTLSTPVVYSIIRDNSLSYAMLVYLNLNKVHSSCSFHGTSYRGVHLSMHELNIYRVAMEKGHLVETTNFCSTSQSRDVAEFFCGEPPEQTMAFPATLIYNFSESTFPCALDLTRDPVISKHPEEEEVLVLPHTIFRVRNADNTYHDSTGCQRWVIELHNINVPKHSFTSFLWEKSQLLR
jgi:hypothetical protein